MNYLNIYCTPTIDGKKGPYDNESIKYGRNAAANYKSHIETYTTKPNDFNKADFSNLSQLSNDQFDKKTKDVSDKIDADLAKPPVNLKLKYKYLPEENIDPKNINKMALLGAAYEELGKRMSVPVEELTALMQKAGGAEFSAEALDINKDKQVDVGEYASSILLTDMLSTDSENVDANNIKGEVNTLGLNKSLAYASKKNIVKAAEMFKAIYNTFGLVQAYEEFTKEKQK